LVDEYFKTEPLTKKEKEVAKKLNITEDEFVDFKKKELKIPPSKSGVCKVCGAGLNPYGDFCLGKEHHKQ